MLKFKRLYDISVTLGNESLAYPDDPTVLRETLSSVEAGDPYEVSRLELSAHSGTHLDFPAHFFACGKTVDSYAVDEFSLQAQVVGIADAAAVGRPELESKPIAEHRALLFKTANSTAGLVSGSSFSAEYVHLTAEAAEFCIEKKSPLVGLDYLSIDKYGDMDFPVHRRLLAESILILENIDLKQVPQGDYLLFCFPLKIARAEASPVRAVLAEPAD